MAPIEQAKYDLLWVLDSTIAITPGTLGRMVDAFIGTPSGASFDADLESTPLISDDARGPPQRGDVGLVHHVPYAVVYQNTWGSLIEQAFLNTTHAKMYLAIVSANGGNHSDRRTRRHLTLVSWGSRIYIPVPTSRRSPVRHRRSARSRTRQRVSQGSAPSWLRTT